MNGHRRSHRYARKSWRLPPYSGQVHVGCLNCGSSDRVASMRTPIAVGFGYAAITRDGVEIYREPAQWLKRMRRLASFERKAAVDPRHDWRLILDAPLRSRVYQRQGPKRWVLVESGRGFA